ncbi:site-specific integrase [Arsenicibacter rosenii]|uniref:Tyr recombinase domain-containing protein n=1 Tax=Arsenicibacter rosenii TaxID=1750698 RepID=A0A1S2VAB8_9BACT|nr:site-specific integrase [Arsenicibacter rosenii]OIN55674.1 hypothetical protein BLX24_28765 [Arsenicibacter rosenii]
MKTSMKVIIKDDYVKKDGTSPLYLQVFINQEMIRFPLDISWPPPFFDKSAGRLKARSKTDKDLSDYQIIIQSKQGRVNEIFKYYRLSEKPLTVEILKKEFYNFRLKQDFLDFWNREMEDRYRRRKIEKGTYVCHSASLSKLKEFRSTIAFGELTPKLLENYRAWLKTKKKNAATTIEKNMKDVRTYVNLAIQDGIVIDNPFKVVKVRHIETVPDVLSIEQVQQLMELYEAASTPENWKRVLQHFLFSCFTGLRISDIMRVKADNIIDGQIIFNAYKTRNKVAKTVCIPLHEIALRYITANVGKLFDTFTDQHCRKILKQIVKAQNWKVRIGTHTARHTFGTTFIELGGDVVTLKEYMGHGKIQTTMKYVHLSERRKREQINVFDRFKKQ